MQTKVNGRILEIGICTPLFSQLQIELLIGTYDYQAYEKDSHVSLVLLIFVFVELSCDSH